MTHSFQPSEVVGVNRPRYCLLGNWFLLVFSESAAKELMWSSHKSAHSCLDMSVDSDLHTDPRPAVKILVMFCEKNYDFFNICWWKWHFVFFPSHNKAETKALMNVLADLYFGLHCVSQRVDVFMNSTWQHIKAESSDVDLTTGKVRPSWSARIGQAHQSTSD